MAELLKLIDWPALGWGFVGGVLGILLALVWTVAKNPKGRREA